jgi:hypothetical protein
LVKIEGYKNSSPNKATKLLDAKKQTNRLIDLILGMNRDLGENKFIIQYRYISERVDLSPAVSQFYFTTVVIIAMVTD